MPRRGRRPGLARPRGLACVLLTGRRPTYRIRRRDLAAFVARYVLDDAGRAEWLEDSLAAPRTPPR